MRRTFLFFILMTVSTLLNAQVSKTVNCTAGGLALALTAVEKSTITNLTIKGSIDARDFKTMRDSMSVLKVIDLSSTSIVSYTGTLGTIDKNNNSYPANCIPGKAYYSKSSLTSINMPVSISSIGTWSFANCNGIVNVNIPNGVTNLQDYAFFACKNLKRATLPSSITTIGWQTFCYNDRMDTVNISSSVNSITSTAFNGSSAVINVNENNQNYSSIEGVLFNKSKTTLITCPISKTGYYAIPGTVTTLDNWAFNFTSKLTEIYVPVSVNSIKTRFLETGAKIVIDVNNAYYSFLEGVLFNKDKSKIIANIQNNSSVYTMPVTVTIIGESAFSDSKNLVSINFPPNLTTIESHAFYSCSKLTTLSIPITVTIVGTQAFTYCTSLKSICVRWLTPLNFGNSLHVFNPTYTQTCKLFVPSGTKSAYQAADQWKDFTNIIEYKIPIADAGADQEVFEGTVASLDGTTSLELDGKTLSYLWKAPPGILLSSDTIIKPIFTVPEVGADSSIIFSLVVNNGIVDSPADTVIITIKNNPIIPVDFSISDTTFRNGANDCFGATQNITVAGDGNLVILENNSSINFIAGNTIRFLPGFHALEGSVAHAWITTDSTFCDVASGAIVENPQPAKSGIVNETLIPVQRAGNEKSIKVYPNPNNGKFTIALTNIELGSGIAIYNALGVKVYQSLVLDATIPDIELAGIRRGLYFVKVTDGKEQITRKMIVD